MRNNLSNKEKNMKAVSNYRPSSALESALSGFDRYLDSFFGDNFFSPTERMINRLPLVDVRETEKAYILEAELPGYDEKDIEIRLDGNTLTIESKKEIQKNEDTGSNYLVRERRATTFIRSFKLPENADAENVSASFKNGILCMEISKKAETQTKVIKIKKE